MSSRSIKSTWLCLLALGLAVLICGPRFQIAQADDSGTEVVRPDSRDRVGFSPLKVSFMKDWDVKTGAPEDTASADVDSASFDFGEVYIGEHISHRFSVRNAGTAPLTLTEAPTAADGRLGNGMGTTSAPYPAMHWYSAFSPIPPAGNSGSLRFSPAGFLGAARGAPA